MISTIVTGTRKYKAYQRTAKEGKLCNASPEQIRVLLKAHKTLSSFVISSMIQFGSRSS
jgi:hypothetical protein